jgi:hypothetical protein
MREETQQSELKFVNDLQKERDDSKDLLELLEVTNSERLKDKQLANSVFLLFFFFYYFYFNFYF